MTCCGAFIAPGAIGAGDVAYVFGDGEVYSGTEPSGAFNKLGVSPGGVAGVATGRASLGGLFVEMVEGLGAGSGEDAVARIPSLLRQAVADKRCTLDELQLPDDTRTTFALAGPFRFGVKAFVFEPPNYDARETRGWASPSLNWKPRDARDCQRFAEQQLSFVRRRIPTATGRALSVARIDASGKVSRTVVPLLLEGERRALGAG